MTPGSTLPLASIDHAFVAGVVSGQLLNRGVALEPVLDDDGDYTAQFTITVDGAGVGLPIEVTIVVLPPGPSTVDGPRSEDDQ